MGREPWSNRKTVEECKTISVFDMLQAGVFDTGPMRTWTCRWSSGVGTETGSIGYSLKEDPLVGPYLQFAYKITKSGDSEATPYDYPVALTTTPCTFGGGRYWFIGPLVLDGKSCNRRVGKLYQPPGREYFGCRHCYNLTYKSCKEHDKTIDAVMRNPALLEYYIERNPFKGMLLAMKAHGKLAEREMKLLKKMALSGER